MTFLQHGLDELGALAAAELLASLDLVLVALVTVHEDLVFFVGDGGIALELLLAGSSCAIALSGAGRMSADSAACPTASRRESAPMRRDASHEPGRADA